MTILKERESAFLIVFMQMVSSGMIEWSRIPTFPGFISIDQASFEDYTGKNMFICPGNHTYLHADGKSIEANVLIMATEAIHISEEKNSQLNSA